MSDQDEHARAFLVAVRDYIGRDDAMEIVRAAGYPKPTALLAEGTSETKAGVIQACAVLLWLAKKPPPFVPPPFRFRTWKRVNPSFDAAVKAATLLDAYLARARELGCTVVFDEIICTEQQMLELNRYWTELWDAK